MLRSRALHLRSASARSRVADGVLIGMIRGGPVSPVVGFGFQKGTAGMLLALLALTVSSSFVHPGVLNSVINLAIAAAKAAIIATLFMQLSSEGVLPRLAVAATGVWLAILFGLTLIGR